VVSGARCSVCNHKDVTLINDTLKRVSQRRTSIMFGLGHDAVRRHVTNQHAGIVVAAQEAAGVTVPGEGASARENLDAVVALLKKKLANATIRVDEIREFRLTLDAIDKMAGGPVPEVTRVQDIEGYAEYEADMMEALEPFPEARMALARVLRAKTSRGEE
jgi:hypothetical protein